MPALADGPNPGTEPILDEVELKASAEREARSKPWTNPSKLQIEINKLESWNTGLIEIAEMRNNLGDYSGAASSEMKVRAIIWALQQLTKGDDFFDIKRGYSLTEERISGIEYETYFRAGDIPRAVIALDYKLEALKSNDKYWPDQSTRGQIRYVEIDRNNLIEDYETNSCRTKMTSNNELIRRLRHPTFVPTLENYPAIVLKCSNEYVLRVTNILSTAGEDIFPLHTYSRCSRLELMTVAIEQGFDAQAIDRDGFMPIHWAAIHGTPEALDLLVGTGMSVDQVTKSDWTALMLAVESKNTDCVNALIDMGAIVSYRGENGWSPLHVAEYNGHEEIAGYLINSGADASARDDAGRLPSEMRQ